MEGNRVLSWEEVMNLPDGASAYGERRFGASETIIAKNQAISRIMLAGWKSPNYGVKYRFWLIPQPPTPDELAANPWPDTKEE